MNCMFPDFAASASLALAVDVVDGSELRIFFCVSSSLLACRVMYVTFVATKAVYEGRALCNRRLQTKAREEAQRSSARRGAEIFPGYF